jgi:hypothetical protein
LANGLESILPVIARHLFFGVFFLRVDFRFARAGFFAALRFFLPKIAS